MVEKVPVLFLPGLLNDGALYQNQIEGLADLIDPYIGDLTVADSVQELARSVLALAPPRFVLTGMSMGGYVAFEIMRQAPERVLKLCLFSTSARPDNPEMKAKRAALQKLAKEGLFKGITPRLLPTLIHKSHVSDEKLANTIMDMAARVGREAFQTQQTAIANRPDSRETLKTIKCPTQIIGGAQDLIAVPEVMQEMADGIKGAKIEFLDPCGHVVPLEQPQRSTQIMREFLAF